ncbi:hypothetical protein BTJ68_05370 [Hortaea werneckii EXF-2000]|nr:hypothetical protein BTJ68_05370 [Hortaea werneckii EXF-2000]
MSRNNEQVFAQPAHENTTVYFMWDFVGRTIPSGMLDQMVTMSYPNQSGEKPVSGNDIKDAARKLM